MLMTLGRGNRRRRRLTVHASRAAFGDAWILLCNGVDPGVDICLNPIDLMTARRRLCRPRTDHETQKKSKSPAHVDNPVAAVRLTTVPSNII
jgi:hypothetical protein